MNKENMKEYPSRRHTSRKLESSRFNKYKNRFNRKRFRGWKRSKFDNTIKFDIVDLIKNPKLHQTEGLKTNIVFDDLGLDPRLVNILNKRNFKNATPIQGKVIPMVLSGKSILGIAPTGTGKTASFLLPIIHRLINDDSKVLIIAPTRELAIQIFKEAKLLNINKIGIALVIGGESINNQIRIVKNLAARIIIGTPGRLLDLENRGVLDFSSFSTFVVDEVDRMLDMGFIEDVRYMYNKLPGKKQVLFFSATSNNKALSIIKGFVPNIQIVSFANNLPVDNVEQNIIYYHTHQDRIDKLIKILQEKHVFKALVFVNTKLLADKVFQQLRNQGINVGVIHGDKTQYKRRKVIDLFRRSNIQVLVATNVAARGIDIYDISHVINFDAPLHKDEYIHRVGRTGRFGRKGFAITFLPKKPKSL